MTTGSTTFNPDFLDIAEEAWERATGGATELRSGYDLRTARRSLNLLLLEWSNLGLNLWTLDEGVLPLVNGQTRYDLPDDTVDLMEFAIFDNSYGLGQAINMQRISISEYAHRQNQATVGRPTSVTVDRQVSNPELLVWPIPDSDNYEIRYWRIRRIQEVGSGTNKQDVPFRFIPALIAGLAYMLATKLPEGAARMSVLKSQYDEAYLLARGEDRDKASVRFVPRSYRF